MGPSQTAPALDSSFNQYLSPKAVGGSVSGGSPYLIGEKGPELFVPSGSGTIIPNNTLANSGGTTNVTNNYINAIDTKSFEQGNILDQVVKDRNIYVFAIEFNFSKELVFLESSYGITKTPSIVVDYRNTFQGLRTYDEIIAVIDSRKG